MPSHRRHRMLSTSTTATVPPQFVIPVPSNFPKLPYNPEKLYRFQSPVLEKTVFTHCSLGTLNRQWGSVLNASPSSTTTTECGEIRRADNEQLEWLGDHILKGLTAHLVTQQHPMLDEGRMSVLTTALVCNRFYAHLSRTLGLDQRLRLAETSGQLPLQSDRVLGGLFEAFVGGMHKELGFEGHKKLYEWFEDLMAPYAHAFWQEMREAENTARRAFNQATPKKDINELLESCSISAEGSTFTSLLNLYASQNQLPPPTFTFEKSGPLHNLSWECTVTLDDCALNVVGPWMKNKPDAKNRACQIVLSKIGIAEMD